MSTKAISCMLKSVCPECGEGVLYFWIGSWSLRCDRCKAGFPQGKDFPHPLTIVPADTNPEGFWRGSWGEAAIRQMKEGEVSVLVGKAA